MANTLTIIEMKVGSNNMSFFRKGRGKPLKFTTSKPTPGPKRNPFSTIDENIDFICTELNNTDDLQIREFTFHKKQGAIILLETMSDTEKIEKTFLTPLRDAKKHDELKDIITNVDLSITEDLNETVPALLKGSCIITINGDDRIYTLNLPKKGLEDANEPKIERSVRGSHQGFVESLESNLNLIRYRIANKNLKINYHKLGFESNKNLALVYLNNIANPELVKDLEKRVLSISMDSIFSPGYIEENIETTSFSPFPQNLYTERTDRLEAHLMEGRIAIMTEGSTNAIIVPVTFFSFFQSIDDFNDRIYATSLFRLLRLFSFFGALLFPALYIAVVGFHFEMIPFEMISLVQNSIGTIPYPPVIEALLMAVTIELIREAGIRLPTPIGETIGIVGGLIIGEAVVNAGFVSNVVVIVIALTAIMSFTNPSYEMGNTVRILSFPIMIAATMFGLVGIVVSIMFLVIHMCKLNSFGTPYLSPLAPLNLKGMKDTFVRFPIWTMSERPEAVKPQKRVRQQDSREWRKGDQ